MVYDFPLILLTPRNRVLLRVDPVGKDGLYGYEAPGMTGVRDKDGILALARVIVETRPLTNKIGPWAEEV